MAIKDAERVYDGCSDWSGGQDYGRNGRLIAANQYVQGENAVCRGGNITTRPAIREMKVNVRTDLYYDANGDSTTDTSLQNGSALTWLNGLFQGALYYDPTLGEDCFVVSVSGRLFQIIPRRTTADLVEIPLDRQNRGSIPIVYMVQADRFLVLQDGEGKPVIYDGVTARRSGKDEVPVGTIMTYGMGRLVVVGNNMKDIEFGDLFGSHEGDPSLSVLKFTETNFLTEGGTASIPFSMGHIEAMGFYPQQDTSMGQGELLVFAEKGMASFFLSLPRDQWKTSAFQRMGLLEIGARGHRSFTPVNGDIWFRSGDGWRAYRQARAEAKGWFQLPHSTEVGNYVDVETESLLTYGSSIRFNNRLIATVTPYPNQGKPYHKGMVSLDFDVLSSFGQATRPSWDGHWNGVKITQLVEGNFNGQHRAFAFGINENGENALYEFREDEHADANYLTSHPVEKPITSSVVPRTFNFQAPFNENGLYDADIWFEDVDEDTTLTAYYKPDQYPNWIPWRPSTPVNALQPINNTVTLAGVPTVASGFYPRKALGKPETFIDEFSTNREAKRSYELQTKLEWTGFAAISRFRVHDKTKVEQATAKI